MTRRRRIFRRTIDVICVVGILLLAGLWVRSWLYVDIVRIVPGPDRYYLVWSYHGVIICGVQRQARFTPAHSYKASSRIRIKDGIEIQYTPRDKNNSSIRKMRWWFDYHYSTSGTQSIRTVYIPIWFLILLLSITPLWHLIDYIRHRRGIPKGHVLCSNCGYDLFGSQGETCPECGGAIEGVKP